MSYERDHRGKLKLSWDEALEVRDTFCRDKDFWTYDLEYNKEILQAALDVLYNGIPGNNYTVSYKDCQNLSRLSILCQPCAKELTSLDPFRSHDEGKNHKKCIMKLKSKKEQERIMRNGFKKKPFNSPKEIFETGTLEYKIDQCKHRILGMQFIYKEKLRPTDDYVFSCQLCRVFEVNADAMFQHLTDSSRHNKLYLRVKFDMCVPNSDAYESACKKIEEQEGKINHRIFDFSEQNAVCASAIRESKPVVERPSSHGVPSTPAATAVVVPPSASAAATTTTQTDTVELDANLPLQRELMLVCESGAASSLAEDQDSLELMLETLQALNLKLHKFYDSHSSTTDLTQTNCAYQESLHAAYEALCRSFDSDVKPS